MKRSPLLHAAFLILVIAVMTSLNGCDKMKDPYLNVNLLTAGKSCEASQCHLSTALFKYPPTSGHHTDHLIRNYNCDVCHGNYMLNPLHMNSLLDTSSGVAPFNDRNPNGIWTPATSTCASLSCHGDRAW